MLKTQKFFNLEARESSIKSILFKILKNKANRLSIRTESYDCLDFKGRVEVV